MYNPQRDYCTGIDWSAINKCCYDHDVAYVEQQSKWDADVAFAQCVADNAGIVAAIVLFPIVLLGGYWFTFRRKLKKVVR